MEERKLYERDRNLKCEFYKSLVGYLNFRPLLRPGGGATIAVP